MKYSLKLTILSVIAEGKVGMAIPENLYAEVCTHWSCSEEAFTQTLLDLYNDNAIIATPTWPPGVVNIRGLTPYGYFLLQSNN